jgi:hypothetical protein
MRRVTAASIILVASALILMPKQPNGTPGK